MYFQETILPPIVIALTAIVFYVVHKGSSRFLGEKHKYLGEELIENISLSTISIVQAICLIFFTILYLLTGYNRIVEILVYITMTSFASEMFISNTMRKDMLYHHIVTICLCILVILQIANDINGDSVNYSLYGSVGLIEVSSVFLHMKYILKNFAEAMSDQSDENIMLSPLKTNRDKPIERLYAAVHILFLITFFLFRVIFLPLLALFSIGMIFTNFISYILFLAFVGLNISWALIMWKKYIIKENK